MPGDTLLHRVRSALAPRYAVEEELAAGGMGVVYLARDTRLGRPVAIKLLQPGIATASALERFQREARTLARLRHPNVLSVHDADEAQGLHFFVMDLVEGQTLAQQLAAGPLKPAEFHALAQGLLAGLGAAHALHIVHRDIKPSNIFLHEGQVAIGDFGIASSLDSTPSEHDLTLPGQPIGTPFYMAPEQAMGGDTTPATDVFAAGLVLYEACTGRPWSRPADPATADWRGVPRRLRQPLLTALADLPEHRWRSARDFALALAPPLRSRTQPAALLLTAAAVAIVAWILTRPPRGPAPAIADLAVLPFVGADASAAADLTRFTAANLAWSPRWSFRPLADMRDRERINARAWAEGRIQSDSAGPTLVLMLYDSAGMTKHTRVPGDPSRMVEWALAVSDSIVASVFPRRAAEFRDLMAASRGDFAANKLLVSGMDAFAADEWDRADSLLRQAIDRDPSLVRAVWELDLLQKWRRQEIPDADRTRLRGAMDRLPDPYASLLRLELEPNLRRRLAGYTALVDSYPRNSRARFLLINEAFHRGPLSGMPLDSALRLMRAGIEKDPYLDQVAMYDPMVWGYLHLGDRVMADSALAERAALIRRLGRRDELGGLLRLVYDARFRPIVGGIRSRGAAWKYGRDPGDLLDYLRLGLTFDAPELQARLGRAVSRGRDPDARAIGHMGTALALFLLGRGQEGGTHLDSATLLLGTPEARLDAYLWRTIPGALGLPIADSVRADGARAALAMLASGDDPLAARAAWALAVSSYASGDTAAGAREQARLQSKAGVHGAAYLGGILAGIAAAARGHPDSAVALTDTLFTDDHSGSLGGPFARAVLHLERGRWLHALGRPAEAEASWLFHENSYLRGWPRGETQSGEADAVLSGLARLLRGELAMERGQAAAGCRLLGRVRELWRAADPAMAPLVARAEKGAASCG